SDWLYAGGVRLSFERRRPWIDSVNRWSCIVFGDGRPRTACRRATTRPHPGGADERALAGSRARGVVEAGSGGARPRRGSMASRVSEARRSDPALRGGRTRRGGRPLSVEVRRYRAHRGCGDAGTTAPVDPRLPG